MLGINGLGYEEGFGPGEVPFSHWEKKQIDTYTILSALGHVEMQKLFGKDGDHGDQLFFGIKCDLYIVDNMDRL